MTTTVYKVVRLKDSHPRTRISVNAPDDDRVYGDRLKYHEGRPTFPKIGKLFAFETFTTALGHLEFWLPAQYVGNERLSSHFELWECEAEGVETPEFTYLPRYDSIEKLKQFWKEPVRWWDFSTCLFPIGTVLCDSITLVKRLERR